MTFLEWGFFFFSFSESALVQSVSYHDQLMKDPGRQKSLKSYSVRNVLGIDLGSGT